VTGEEVKGSHVRGGGWLEGGWETMEGTWSGLERGEGGEVLWLGCDEGAGGVKLRLRSSVRSERMIDQ